MVNNFLGNFEQNPHFQAIQEYYGDQRAQRSNVPYINHIREGLLVLDAIDATLPAREAYCLHPIVQGDDALKEAFAADAVLARYPINVYSLVLAMEYRSVANAYLSTRQIQSLAEIKLSPLDEVQQMLIADKVQNRKDFEAYHMQHHTRSKELTAYFKNWLEVLSISEKRYAELTIQIDQACFDDSVDTQ